MLAVLIEVNCIVDGKIRIVVIFLKHAAVAEIGIPGNAGHRAGPTLCASQRTGHALEILAIVARVNLRIEIVDSGIYDPCVVATEIKAFANIEKLALSVGFKTGFETSGSAFALDAYKSGGQLAVFH